MDVYILKQYSFDIIVIGIILGCAIRAYQKGFVSAGLSFLPTILGIASAYFCSPILSRILRKTPFFTWMTESIYNNLDINKLFSGTFTSQRDMIESMKIPLFLKNSLLENDNPVVYQVLDVQKGQDYIASFLANVCLNIISVLAAFFIAVIIAKFFLAALNLVMQLPILSFFNKASGLMIGTLQGVVIVWIIGLVLTFFHYNPKFYSFFQLLENSKIASVFYENNLLLLMILKVFT